MESVFFRFQSYDFESDQKFQEGLKVLHESDKKKEESPLQDMKLFFYNRSLLLLLGSIRHVLYYITLYMFYRDIIVYLYYLVYIEDHYIELYIVYSIICTCIRDIILYYTCILLYYT